MNVSEIELERFALNELPADRAARMAERVAGDVALGERVSAIAGADRELPWLAPGVRARLRATPTRQGRALGWAVSAVAVVILGVIVAPIAWPRVDPDERVKGPAASISIYRQTADGSQQLDERSVAHTGDVIRIGYQVSDPAYGAIVSVDTRGVVTVHLPQDAPVAAPLENGTSALLGHAYELDDAPQWERFFIVTSRTPFAIDAVVTAARRGGATLELSGELTQSTFLLQKDSRP